MRRLGHRLRHAHVNVALAMFVFWTAQFVIWIGMILFVQFVDPSLGTSVLYVTQISHWALVEAAGTAAISSWALYQSQHNSRRIEEVHEDVDPHDKTPLT